MVISERSLSTAEIIKKSFLELKPIETLFLLSQVVRLWNGPTFRGSKPILVSFHLYKDKEEILRKNATYLKGREKYTSISYLETLQLFHFIALDAPTVKGLFELPQAFS